MGLDRNGTLFMLHAQAQGVDFSRTAMIGRQGLHLKPHELRANALRFGLPWDEASVAGLFSESGGFAEAFLKKLGAEEVHSFDRSAYEGATHVHDMNRAIPDAWKQQYSAVLDGGSLEHVFDFPTAIRNCMEMLRPGGHYLGITPTNNFMGHGFYQFSPELLFRVFSGENGFEMLRMIIIEDRPNAPWYAVSDPASVGQRVGLINAHAAYLLVIAKRAAIKPPFETTPQQSDYAVRWLGGKAAGEAKNTWSDRLKRQIWSRLPSEARLAVKRILWRGRDPRFFHRIDPVSAQAPQNG